MMKLPRLPRFPSEAKVVMVMVVLALAAPLALLARVMTKVPGAKEETRLAGRRRGSAGSRRRWRSS